MPEQNWEQFKQQNTNRDWSKHVPITAEQYTPDQRSQWSDVQAVGGSLYGVRKPLHDSGFRADVPSKIDAQTITQKQDATGLLNKTKERENIQARVLDTYSTRPDVGSNRNFINAAYVAAYGTDAPMDVLEKFEGKPVKDVVRSFHLDPNFGVGDTEPVSDTDIPNVPADVPEEQKSSFQKIVDSIRGLVTGKEKAYTKAAKEYELEDKSDVVTKAEQSLNKARTELSNLGIAQLGEQLAIEDKPIHTSLIKGYQSNLSKEQKLDYMIKQNEYNNKLVEVQIAQGSYERAREIVKEIADDAYQAGLLEIEALKAQGILDEKSEASAKEALKYERSLAEKGFVYIQNPAQLEGLTEDDIFRDPVTKKIYLRPTAASKTQVVTADGRKLLIDSATGKTIKDLGGAYKPTGSGAGTSKGIKFSSDDRERLGQYFSQDQVNNLQENLQKFSVEEIIARENFTDEQKKVLRNVSKGVTPTQEAGVEEEGKEFLNEQYFRDLFGDEGLTETAKKGGFTTGGFLGMGKKGDVTAYLANLMNMVRQYREAGYTDKDILKMFPKAKK